MACPRLGTARDGTLLDARCTRGRSPQIRRPALEVFMRARAELGLMACPHLGTARDGTLLDARCIRG
eukprot:13875072-Alexandrium_andersonii.AAC.1